MTFSNNYHNKFFFCITKLPWRLRIWPKFRRCTSKRLSDAFEICSNNAWASRTRPAWCGHEACEGLLAYWACDEFKGKSARNETNQDSRRGRAVHTTGHKAHIEVALDMDRELGRTIDSDEFFVATHTKKYGGWVDDRARSTYLSKNYL